MYWIECGAMYSVSSHLKWHVYICAKLELFSLLNKYKILKIMIITLKMSGDQNESGSLTIVHAHVYKWIQRLNLRFQLAIMFESRKKRMKYSWNGWRHQAKLTILLINKLNPKPKNRHAHKLTLIEYHNDYRVAIPSIL